MYCVAVVGVGKEKRGVVVQTDNKYGGDQSAERIIAIIQAKWNT